MVVRLLDLVLDPLLGTLIDATRSRFGQFRPWMALGSPVLMASAYMMFMARPGAGLFYLIGWLCLLYASYSILILAHAAWASTLASGYNDRSRVFSWLQNVAVVGMVLVLLLPAVVAPLAPHDRAAGVRAMGWFIIALTPVTMGLALWRTPEPLSRSVRAVRAGPALFVRLLRRPAVARLLAADLCLAIAPGISGAIFIFFFREARGFTTAQSSLLLLLYFLGGLVGAPLWAALAGKVGKHRALMIAALHYAVMTGSTLILPKAAFWLTAPFMVLTGLAYSAPTILLRAMLSDAADEAELDGESNRTGLLFAMITSTNKIGFALAIGLCFPILQLVGFNPHAGAANTPSAVRGLEQLFVIGPVIFSCLAVAALEGYKLDASRHAAISAGLQKLREGGAAASRG
jgi:Na+/melibiose symporter-like transporter